VVVTTLCQDRSRLDCKPIVRVEKRLHIFMDVGITKVPYQFANRKLIRLCVIRLFPLSVTSLLFLVCPRQSCRRTSHAAAPVFCREAGTEAFLQLA
jgi:hypothetical protein